MTLKGSEVGDAYQVVIEARYKGESSSEKYIADLKPTEAIELFEVAKTARAISFNTVDGELVLIYTDSLKFIKRTTTAGAGKEEPNKCEEVV